MDIIAATSYSVEGKPTASVIFIHNALFLSFGIGN